MDFRQTQPELGLGQFSLKWARVDSTLRTHNKSTLLEPGLTQSDVDLAQQGSALSTWPDLGSTKLYLTWVNPNLA